MKVLSKLLLALVTGTACFVVSAQISGRELSKEQIISLQKAGVNDTVLIQQINKDGINFDMTADTTLELKRAGISNTVLQALLKASVKAKVASHPSTDDTARALYTAGKFPELADRLRSELKVSPTNYRTKALLIMVLLKMKEKDVARVEFQELAMHQAEPGVAPLVKQVTALLDRLDKAEEVKRRLVSALKDYKVSEAIALIDELPASDVQKGILKINLDIYQANFNEARNKFNKLEFSTYSEKESAKGILNHISDAASEYQKIRSRLDVYLYSSYAPSYCYSFSYPHFRTQVAPEFLQLSVQEYVELVGKLARIAPLNNDAIDLMFHAELLTGRYQDTEQLGDRILSARGKLAIPFFSRDGFFKVVLDNQRKRIYTEPDPHPFKVRYSTESWGKEVSVNDWWSELVPFDLSFDQISELTQKARRRRGAAESIVSKSYALKFGSGGLAPNYALMNILYCTAGEKAEMTVTHDLGQYVSHLIGRSNLKTELADPRTAAGPSSGWVTGLLALGSITQPSPLTQLAIQNLQTTQAQESARLQAEQANWSAITGSDTFNFIEADAFGGLEQLLGVLN